MSKAQGPYVAPLAELAGTTGNTLVNREFLMKGSPAQTYETNIPISFIGVMTSTALSATGVGLAAAIALQQGDIISNITFVTSTVAASVPTHQYVALYDNAATPNLLATSGDLTTTARAANTVYTIPLTKQVTIATTGVYYISISFTATVVPTLIGLTSLNAANNGALVGSPVLAESHGSALAGVAPSTIASPTTVVAIPFFILT